MPPRRVVHRQHVARRDRAGVVHQDVQLARLRRDAPHRRVGRQVGRDGPDIHLPARADRRGGLIQRRLLARHQDHVAALIRQHLGRRPADALRAAGDQCALARQLQIHLNSPSLPIVIPAPPIVALAARLSSSPRNLSLRRRQRGSPFHKALDYFSLSTRLRFTHSLVLMREIPPGGYGRQRATPGRRWSATD